VALRFQQGGDRIAQRRLAPVPDVQRTGRIGGDEFHLHLLRLGLLRAPVVAPLRQHAVDDARFRARLEPEVDEPRAGDFRFFDQTQDGRGKAYR
jgi:hypothetical protein